MDNSIDLLQIKINEARDLLPKESREAIDDVNWKLIIRGMKDQYTEEQLEDLVTETELLLSGILLPDEYEKSLKQKLMLNDEGVFILLKDLDDKIFKKIQEGLEKKINRSPKAVFENKPLVLDPRFIGMPKETQEAVARSDWKEKLYKISKDYNLNIEQMGILEDITVKVMKNETHPSKYESEVISKITIPREDISSLIKDVNDTILLKIRELMRVNEGQEDVPLPPYGKIITNDKLLINNEIEIEKVPVPPYEKVITNEETIKKEESISPAVGLEISNEKTPSEKQEESKKINDIIEKDELKDVWEAKPSVISPEIKSAPLNIMDEKLKSVTMSDHVVTDYSIPKISDPSKEVHEAPAKSNDPYREAF
ncbi:MAG: hypothetical protein JJE53_00295 [Candidatus Pacebacteria bacterium]|nr:hypothetical protein [Candidatus Paceibacterota bacterium]